MRSLGCEEREQTYTSSESRHESQKERRSALLFSTLRWIRSSVRERLQKRKNLRRGSNLPVPTQTPANGARAGIERDKTHSHHEVVQTVLVPTGSMPKRERRAWSAPYPKGRGRAEEGRAGGGDVLLVGLLIFLLDIRIDGLLYDLDRFLIETKGSTKASGRRLGKRRAGRALTDVEEVGVGRHGGRSRLIEELNRCGTVRKLLSWRVRWRCCFPSCVRRAEEVGKKGDSVRVLERGSLVPISLFARPHYSFLPLATSSLLLIGVSHIILLPQNTERQGKEKG